MLLSEDIGEQLFVTARLQCMSRIFIQLPLISIQEWSFSFLLGRSESLDSPVTPLVFDCPVISTDIMERGSCLVSTDGWQNSQLSRSPPISRISALLSALKSAQR